jgi:hypothetical protein
MNRQAMEHALGKLIMDARFRDAFFDDPLAASLAAGLQLTEQECRELGHIRPGALAAFQRYLDGKRFDRVEDIRAQPGSAGDERRAAR